jgi:hypothetical protein
MTQPLAFTPFFEGDKLSPVKPALLSLRLGNVSQQSPNGRESLIYMWSRAYSVAIVTTTLS